MLADYKEDIYHCLKCGACRTAFQAYTPICPSGFQYGFDSYYAIGRVDLARAVLEDRLAIDAEVMRRIYSCTSCGGCDEQCNPAVGISPLRIIEAFKHQAIEKGLIPPEVRDFLKGLQVHGNPYLEPSDERGRWAEGTPLESYSDQDYLFYVGCVGSYDERGQGLARTVGELLQSGGLSFGILGNREICDGNEANRVGERGLFEFLATHNIELFRELGIRKVVALSPHGFHAMKNDYAKWDAGFEVAHYTQILQAQVRKGSLRPRNRLEVKATFHDPCFLGRHNAEFEAPRFLLKSIPGLELIEMDRNRRNSFCCGGGGGNFFTDMIGSGVRSPSRVRVREAVDTGAEVLAVACPNCRNMLEDAVKAEGLEDRLQVRDVAHLLAQAVGVRDRGHP